VLRAHYLGIDGGGSHTRALLCDASGQIIGKGLSGATNPRATPAAELKAHLLAAIQQACAEVEIASIRAAYLGIAGCGEPVSQAATAAVARACLGDPEVQITVGHDLETVLEGSLLGQPGIVLIAGTGSACYGRNSQDQLLKCGGWGDLVDDVGSGGWMGLRALQAAVRQADGRAPTSPLKARVMQFLGIDTMEAFSTRIHQQGLSRSQRAQLAPAIIDLAKSGDNASAQILTEAVAELCALAICTVQQLQLSPPRIVLAGGLMAHPYFYGLVAKSLTTCLANASATRPRLDAAAGAVLLAFKSVGSVAGESTIKQLEKLQIN